MHPCGWEVLRPETSDGHVMVAAYTEKRWPALCAALGDPSLATDPRFDTNEKRVRGRTELRDTLEPLFAGRTTAEWIAVLDDADVLCGPLLAYPELVAEEHVQQSGSLVTVAHSAIGEMRSPALPGRFSETSGDLTNPPPPIPGEHSVAVLEECGFTGPEISELIDRGVVVGSSGHEA
jgi:crotonobetainyl-CoA:carnitine CoA-transferase CaiB-like acyl-CoA transferase